MGILFPAWVFGTPSESGEDGDAAQRLFGEDARVPPYAALPMATGAWFHMRDKEERQDQLLTLLHELIDGNGRLRAAKILGVNPRTLSRAANTNELTRRMTDALERHRLQNESSATARQRRLHEDLVRRVDSLARNVKAIADLSGQGLAEVRDGLGAAMRDFESRLSALETDQGTSILRGGSRRNRPSNSSPFGNVISESECAEGEELGLAGPLVADWRKARAEFAGAADEPARAEAERKQLEIEIELVGAHEITLPPAKYPWDRFRREDEVRRRTRRLGEVRAELDRAARRRFLRRLMTFGLWRG